MTTAEAEAEQLLAYRLKRFEALGLNYPEALQLAAGNSDLHAAEDMARDGCSPTLLVAILAD